MTKTTSYLPILLLVVNSLLNSPLKVNAQGGTWGGSVAPQTDAQLAHTSQVTEDSFDQTMDEAKSITPKASTAGTSSSPRKSKLSTSKPVAPSAASLDDSSLSDSNSFDGSSSDGSMVGENGGETAISSATVSRPGGDSSTDFDLGNDDPGSWIPSTNPSLGPSGDDSSISTFPSGCIPLRNSGICSPWSNFAVYGKNSLNAHDVLGFDNYLLNSTAATLSDLHCDPFNGLEKIRYRLTVLCFAAVALDSPKCGLNQENDASGIAAAAFIQPKVCKSTCDLYSKAWAIVLSDKSICPSASKTISTKRQAILKGFQKWCSQTTQSDSQCVGTIPLEQTTCGKFLFF